jgi:hypothetical protein
MKHMKDFVTLFGLIATSALLLLAVVGCGSTGSSGNSSTSSGTNYGTGMNDPWPALEPTTVVSPTTGAPGAR